MSADNEQLLSPVIEQLITERLDTKILEAFQSDDIVELVPGFAELADKVTELLFSQERTSGELSSLQNARQEQIE